MDYSDREFQALIERTQREGGVDARDLRPKDVLVVEVGTQTITLRVVRPDIGEVIISSNGNWHICLHLCRYWGSTLHPDGMAIWLNRIIPGQRLCLGAWTTPLVTRIVLNGVDLTTPVS